MERDLARVLNHYGLGQLRGARRTEHGFVDENWVIDTERGRYFLKRRHPHRRQSHELIQAQHDLIRWLHRAGFPAPVLVANTVGETFLVLDEELYELGEYIKGEPYNPDRPAHLAAAAQTLGTFHTLVRGFALRAALCERSDLYGSAKTRTILENLLAAWRVEGDPGSARVAQQLQDQVADLADRFATHGELPRQVIHGDYYAGNLLFEGDRIVGVVDYDKANWQPRVAEVAEALIYFSSPRRDCLKYLVYSGFLAQEPFARFLQHYAGADTLDRREVWALPDYVGCIWLSMSLQGLLERHPERPAEAELALEEVLALGTWAGANAQQMKATAQAVMDAAAPHPQEDVS